MRVFLCFTLPQIPTASKCHLLFSLTRYDASWNGIEAKLYKNLGCCSLFAMHQDFPDLSFISTPGYIVLRPKYKTTSEL